MNYIYPAIFYPEDDGRYSVIFPDLNDLATFGDTLADAFAMAQDACGQYLFTSLRDGEPLPSPSSVGSIEKDEDNAFINLIGVNLDEYARLYDDKAVKKTLSIPAWLNTACENSGINYSKVLKEALVSKLQTMSSPK
ncbi:MAG: type II toxin-antitoxin system HicB family antitoxin [Lachnospiraceae bacterium]|nr:type II toxin-antitoxin system HicB family antitoxin [Lachnospiraceae bacterium]